MQSMDYERIGNGKINLLYVNLKTRSIQTKTRAEASFKSLYQNISD